MMGATMTHTREHHTPLDTLLAMLPAAVPIAIWLRIRITEKRKR